jgi:hypothetical protein
MGRSPSFGRVAFRAPDIISVGMAFYHPNSSPVTGSGSGNAPLGCALRGEPVRKVSFGEN